MFASDRSITSQGFLAVYTTINATSSNIVFYALIALFVF